MKKSVLVSRYLLRVLIRILKKNNNILFLLRYFFARENPF